MIKNSSALPAWKTRKYFILPGGLTKFVRVKIMNLNVNNLRTSGYRRECQNKAKKAPEF
jgi:hypothetical protein